MKLEQIKDSRDWHRVRTAFQKVYADIMASDLHKYSRVRRSYKSAMIDGPDGSFLITAAAQLQKVHTLTRTRLPIAVRPFEEENLL